MARRDGWIVVDKPEGPTSAAIVGRVRRALRRAGLGATRIGHGGTLDPLATGVLPLALGEATKLAGGLLHGTKAYRFRLAFGFETTSGDRDGQRSRTSAHRPTARELEAVAARFVGEIEQVPPLHAAIRIDGQRGYQLVRKGAAVEPPARLVTIHGLRLLECGDGWADFAVECGPGTYVRALARDLARAADSAGHVTTLCRTVHGPFRLEQAIEPQALLDSEGDFRQEAFRAALLPLTAGLDDIPVLSVDPRQARLLRQGVRLRGSDVPSGLHLAMLDDEAVALVSAGPDGLRVKRGFAAPEGEEDKEGVL